MLQKNPSRRASLEEIEAHHWLQGLDNALLSPEAPPHWLSGALSPSSPRAGLPECGDLLAARPPTQQAFPGPCQPSLSFTLRPPSTEEPPVPKNLPALQQICEEEEEEGEEEELEGSLATEAEDMASVLLEEPEREAEEMIDAAHDQECRDKEHKEEEELRGPMEIMEREEEEQEEMLEMETEKEDGRCVISDQPVSHGDMQVSETHEAPPSSLPGLGAPCCQGLSDSQSPEEGNYEETEPNNNTHKPPPLIPESFVPSVPVSSARIILNEKEAPKTEREGEQDEKTEDGEREDLVTDRSQSHNALGTRDEAAPKAEQGKRHSIKLRDRLFQFPLCEKALAFNIPTHNKPKILPLAQYNCCHVL